MSGVEARVLYGPSSGPALAGSVTCFEEDIDLLSCIETSAGNFTDCSGDSEIQFPVGVRCEGEMKLIEVTYKQWVF